METKRTEAVPFPAQGTGEIADLSSELEQQLNQQLESLDYGSEFSRQNFSRTEEDFSRDSQGLSGTRPFITEGEEGGEHRESAPEKPSGKTASLINESKFLRYIADLRKADSELALAKAESAELVHQIDNFREHYTEYEQKISGLITEQDQSLQKQLDTLTELAHSVQVSSDSLSTRIDREIQRLTQGLEQAIQGSVKDSCDQELARVKDATDVLLNYSETVKSQSIRFQNLEKFKFVLFIISSVSSPIVLILFLLNLLHVF